MRKKIKELSLQAAAIARQEYEMVAREERNAHVEKLQVRKYFFLSASFYADILQRESVEFITFDNLDAKVQEAVDNEVDLNFALTLSGAKIRNRQ